MRYEHQSKLLIQAFNSQCCSEQCGHSALDFGTVGCMHPCLTFGFFHQKVSLSCGQAENLGTDGSDVNNGL